MGSEQRFQVLPHRLRHAPVTFHVGVDLVTEIHGRNATDAFQEEGMSLKQAKAKANVAEQNKAALAKKAAKAAKTLAPGAKPATNQGADKERQKLREQLKRTGSPDVAAQWLLRS